jgi:hypothetical protein
MAEQTDNSTGLLPAGRNRTGKYTEQVTRMHIAPNKNPGAAQLVYDKSRRIR